MRKGSYREFRPGVIHHVFVKAINGMMLFYSREDLLFFLTLYSCLARKYKITVRAFCIMPNHIHSCESAEDRESFLKFHSHLESVFAREYNRRHHRSGPVFQQQFGYAPKVVAKKVRDNISYIANNPVVGKLAGNVLEYRWNLLAYYNCKYPYSTNKGSRALRHSKEMVRCIHKSSRPLVYPLLDRLYQRLKQAEQQCLTDYIVSLYNFIDYTSLLNFYNHDFKQMVFALNANSGSEYDIPEDCKKQVFVQQFSEVFISADFGNRASA